MVEVGDSAENKPDSIRKNFCSIWFDSKLRPRDAYGPRLLS